MWPNFWFYPGLFQCTEKHLPSLRLQLHQTGWDTKSEACTFFVIKVSHCSRKHDARSKIRIFSVNNLILYYLCERFSVLVSGRRVGEWRHCLGSLVTWAHKAMMHALLHCLLSHTSSAPVQANKTTLTVVMASCSISDSNSMSACNAAHGTLDSRLSRLARCCGSPIIVHHSNVVWRH